MSKRILLGCYEVPGWGGSSTVLYHLFERMQREGLDVSYVNLLSEQDEIFLRRVFPDSFGNPCALENVHTCIVKTPLWRAHAGLARLIESLAPDLLFGLGLIAARLFKLAAPRVPVVFMTAGSRHLGHLIETRVIRDFIDFRKRVERGNVFSLPSDRPERHAVESSDLIIVNSPLIRFAFDHFFSSQTGKIYANTVSIADFVSPEAERFTDLRRPFAERDIDALFIASDWSRPEKNYPLVRKIVARCDGLSVHIVGKADRPCPRARHHGVVVRREELYGLLGRSKTLVCPSSLDAAPAVLFEAAAMDCNIVATPNCGNWEICNEELVGETCSRDAFARKIESSVKAPRKDNRERFRGGYDDLVETLSVF